MSSPPALDVSRETLARLEHFAALLRKWTPRINLVARSTVDELWTRHIIDSAQLHALAPHPVTHWADIGSGGGFPGLVIAIMAMEYGSPRRVTLVESDRRKCVFLRTAIREIGAPATVVDDRVENAAPLGADVLSARALADLSTLLAYADRHLAPEGVALFPKGDSWKKELAAARTAWNFRHQVAKSSTEAGPAILSIAGVSRV
jgi:16S rRNA (guanine527-N7)-methyltransferase